MVMNCPSLKRLNCYVRLVAPGFCCTSDIGSRDSRSKGFAGGQQEEDGAHGAASSTAVSGD